jgi:hypothetical protein
MHALRNDAVRNIKLEHTIQCYVAWILMMRCRSMLYLLLPASVSALFAPSECSRGGALGVHDCALDRKQRWCTGRGRVSRKLNDGVVAKHTRELMHTGCVRCIFLDFQGRVYVKVEILHMHKVFNDCKVEFDKILVHFLVHLLLSSCDGACS